MTKKCEKADKKKIRELEKWVDRKGSVNLTELVVKCNGWTCECCGSNKDLDAYHLKPGPETGEDGRPFVDSRSNNLICLCPRCFRKYHGNPVEALRNMTNPQIFKDSASDPRLKKYC